MFKQPLKIAAGLLICLCVIGVWLISHPAFALSLKHNSVVTDDTIKLGDVFQGLSSNQERVLGISPRPGTEMVLNARTLLRIAIALDLPWRPSSAADQVVLRRAATYIGRDAIEQALRDEIRLSGVSGSFELLIPNVASEIILPQQMPATLEVTALNIHPENGFFEATLAAPSRQNPVKELQVTGTIQKMIDIPVLRQPLNAGAIIGERDISVIQLREQDIKHNIVLDPAHLIGLTPRRMVLAGKPILADEVQAPVIVKRGDMVTMKFEKGTLALTTRAKALQDGAMGDTIRVVNATSNKMLDAQVSGSQEVVVTEF